LQLRIEAYAQRVAEAQQEAEGEPGEGEQDEEAAAQPAEQQRHVRFNERVTEYPIPARRVSRRANATASTGEERADEAAPEVPLLKISDAHRFEG
jgi:hypothetical protein